MAQKHKIFPDVLNDISKGQLVGLQNLGYLNKDNTVVGWTRLAPRLRDRELSQRCAKMLILLELDQSKPREDMVRRLVSYLSYKEKEQTLIAVNKILRNQ